MKNQYRGGIAYKGGLGQFADLRGGGLARKRGGVLLKGGWYSNAHYAGQLPQEHLSFLQNLLDFIITKYLKQEVDENLTVCVDKHSPCGLSMTGDIKIYQCFVIKR